MQSQNTKPRRSTPNDDHTRRYIALLLVVPYVVLILTMPFYPVTRDGIIILGPFVGYTVRYLFEVRRGEMGEE